jgi:dinuclear metal center YbgI/SA1388 family protein
MQSVQELIAAIDVRYPLARAESWDRVGLQVGAAQAEVSKALVAHEVTDAVIDAAQGCEALVVYHPLIFRPLENLDTRNHIARLAGRCLAQGLNVVAVHTALDSAPVPGALGDHLARELGLENIEVLQPAGREKLCKIVVFVPPEALYQVSAALWEAGAGQIGDYDRASFRTQGTGTFRPLAGANPYSGEVGKLEEVDEWRLEVIVPEAAYRNVVSAMIAAHPYEEVAYDVYPLHNVINPYGSARMGQLPAPMPLDDWARQVQQALRAPGVRVVQSRATVSKVACVPGSGASYIDAAVRARCDCLVTGDIKHHDALKARALKLSIVDATHTATERAAVGLIADALNGLEIEVVRCDIDTNPFA